MRQGAQRGASWPALLFIVALVAAALWWYAAPESLPAVVRAQLPAAAPARAPLLYKWTDDKGRLNYTDQPPQGRPYSTVRIDPERNVLPAGVPPEAD